MTDQTPTADAFLGGALMLRQPARGYRAGIDPVLLAATCPDGDRPATILDCGAGVGTIGLCVARRLPHALVTLIERETSLAALARDNIAANGLQDRVDLVEADLTGPLSAIPAIAHRAGTFHHVLANPPYYATASGTRSANTVKDGANAMADDALEDWVRFMAAMTRGGGTATIIHRPDALRQILDCLANRFGQLKILPVHPRQGEPANRIIIRGTKGSRAPLTLLSPLLIHATNSAAYQPDIEAVLRHGAALPIP